MSLTSKEKFELFVPVNKSFTEGDSIDDFISQAEDKYLIPLIGRPFYNELLAIGAPAGKQIILLNLVYRAVAYTATWLYLPFGSVQISDSGIQIVSTNDRKQAFEWQIDRLEKAAATKGMDGLEEVLLYLEQNLTDFATYRDSDTRLANNAYFTNTAAAFDDVYKIGRSRLTFMCLWPLVKEVEDTLISPLLGTYAATLRTKIQANSLLDADKTALTAIQRATAYLVIREAIPQLSLELSPSGLSVNFLSQSLTTKASTPAPDTRIQSILSHVKEKSAAFLSDLPTLLPGYVVPAAPPVYNIDNGCNSIVSLF